MSSQVLARLPDFGSHVKLYTYLQVREDGVTLFGFMDRDTLSVFRQLIGVNGIGPKAAVGILSAFCCPIYSARSCGRRLPSIFASSSVNSVVIVRLRDLQLKSLGIWRRY